MTETDSGYCVVVTTCESVEQAEVVADAVLTSGLAACVQVSEIRSWFMWKGARTVETEQLMLIKTKSELYGLLEARIKEVHSYETPEIICLPVSAGSTEYLGWISSVTREPVAASALARSG